MSKANLFKEYLANNQIYMEENVLEDGSIFFRTEQNMDNGGSVLLVVVFTPEDIVDFKVFNIAKLNNPLKKEAFHSLINDLNAEYRFTKFFEDQGSITASYSMPIDKNFDPQEIFDKLIMLYRSSEDSFSKFMKLLWA